jgi:hypothetical protein
MTGGEHYRRAESHIAEAHELAATGAEGLAHLKLRFASVHATLAHAAAMVNDTWGREHDLEPARDQSLGQL